MSMVEAATNVVVGYGIAVATQAMVFALFGRHAGPADNLLLGAIYVAVSIARSDTLRRLFEALRRA